MRASQTLRGLSLWDATDASACMPDIYRVTASARRGVCEYVARGGLSRSGRDRAGPRRPEAVGGAPGAADNRVSCMYAQGVAR